MLKTCPAACSQLIRAITASTRSSHVAEAAGLLARAVDLDGLVLQGPLHEARHDHAVAAGLPRPDRVEEPGADDAQAVLLVKGLAQELVDGLAARVGPAGERGAAEHEVVVLAEGDLLALAVDFAAGGQQDLAAELVRRFEDDLGAGDVRLDRVDGVVGDELHADGGRQMEDHVALRDEQLHQADVADVAFDELQPGCGGRSRGSPAGPC